MQGLFLKLYALCQAPHYAVQAGVISNQFRLVCDQMRCAKALAVKVWSVGHRSATAPWREVAMQAVENAVSPAASTAPATPANTSPVPAVASLALPLALMRGVTPGAAMTLPAPLRMTTQAKRSARVCAAAKRSACTCAVDMPSKRAASKGCGVKIVEKWRSLICTRGILCTFYEVCGDIVSLSESFPSSKVDPWWDELVIEQSANETN